jgi:hypothetical protein
LFSSLIQRPLPPLPITDAKIGKVFHGLITGWNKIDYDFKSRTSLFASHATNSKAERHVAPVTPGLLFSQWLRRRVSARLTEAQSRQRRDLEIRSRSTRLDELSRWNLPRMKLHQALKSPATGPVVTGHSDEVSTPTVSTPPKLLKTGAIATAFQIARPILRKALESFLSVYRARFSQVTSLILSLEV